MLSFYLVIFWVDYSFYFFSKFKVSCKFDVIFDFWINVINKYSDRIMYEF